MRRTCLLDTRSSSATSSTERKRPTGAVELVFAISCRFSIGRPRPHLLRRRPSREAPGCLAADLRHSGREGAQATATPLLPEAATHPSKSVVGAPCSGEWREHRLEISQRTAEGAAIRIFRSKIKELMLELRRLSCGRRPPFASSPVSHDSKHDQNRGDLSRENGDMPPPDTTSWGAPWASLPETLANRRNRAPPWRSKVS